MPIPATVTDTQVLTRKILGAIKGRRGDYEDTRENEAYISGLKEALSFVHGIEFAHRLLQEQGESYW